MPAENLLYKGNTEPYPAQQLELRNTYDNMPNKSLQLRVSLTSYKSTSFEVEDTIEKNGNGFAVIDSFIFKPPSELECMLKKASKRWVFVSRKGVPERAGWYQVNRKERKLIRMPSKRSAMRLDVARRLYVEESAVKAAAEGRPLALLMDAEGFLLSGNYRFLSQAKAIQVNGNPIRLSGLSRRDK